MVCPCGPSTVLRVFEVADPAEALAPLLARFSHVNIGLLALGLACQLAKLGALSRVWRCVLRCTYPTAPLRGRDVMAAYAAGAGINAVLPARAGLLARAALMRGRIAGATYEALAGTMGVESALGAVPMLALLAIAVVSGVLPGVVGQASLAPPSVSQLPVVLIVGVTAAALALTLTVALAPSVRVRARRVVARLREGGAILRDPRAVAAATGWHSLAWGLRLACIWAFLGAFGLSADPGTVLLVVVVQMLSSMLPLSPNGAGAQQGLMVVALAAIASSDAILAFAIGMQVAIGLLDMVAGSIALVALGAHRLRRGTWLRLGEAAA